MAAERRNGLYGALQAVSVDPLRVWEQQQLYPIQFRSEEQLVATVDTPIASSSSSSSSSSSLEQDCVLASAAAHSCLHALAVALPPWKMVSKQLGGGTYKYMYVNVYM